MTSAVAVILEASLAGEKILSGLKHSVFCFGVKISLSFDFCFLSTLGDIIVHGVLIRSVSFSALELRGLLRLVRSYFFAIDETVSRLIEQ
jgi:hypothetical protein